jgi:hypothetical protein
VSWSGAGRGGRGGMAGQLRCHKGDGSSTTRRCHCAYLPVCPLCLPLLTCLPARLPSRRLLAAYRDNRGDSEGDRAFDVLTRELVFEAKAKPGERTLTGGGWGASGCCRVLMLPKRSARELRSDCLMPAQYLDCDGLYRPANWAPPSRCCLLCS